MSSLESAFDDLIECYEKKIKHLGNMVALIDEYFKNYGEPEEVSEE